VVKKRPKIAVTVKRDKFISIIKTLNFNELNVVLKNTFICNHKKRPHICGAG